MKRTELFFSILLVPLDFFALLFAAWAAHRIRFLGFVEEIRPVLYDISAFGYFRSVVAVALVWIFFFALAGLYRRRVTDTWVSEFGRIFFACSAGLTFVVFFVFFSRELFSSRFIVLLAWALAIVFVSFIRFAVRFLQRQLFKFGYGARRVAVVGDKAFSDEVARGIKDHPEVGYVVSFRFSSDLESLDELRNLARQKAIDEIHFVDPESSSARRMQFLEFAEEAHITFRYAPDVLASPIGNPVIDLDIGVPLIEVPVTAIRGWGRIMKRIFDLVGSAIGLILFAPLYFFLGLIIILDTGRPVFYKSKRVGHRGYFILYKLRTMKLEHCIGDEYGSVVAQEFYERLVKEQSERAGPVPKIINDPRLTKTGRWLRRFSLDELPQLWNVFKGEMSLVGPRPHLPEEVSSYQKHHQKVLAIKPGMTGLAQVNGRSDLDFEDEVRLDRYYIERWSFVLDIMILFKTIPALLRSRRAL